MVGQMFISYYHGMGVAFVVCGSCLKKTAWSAQKPRRAALDRGTHKQHVGLRTITARHREAWMPCNIWPAYNGRAPFPRASKNLNLGNTWGLAKTTPPWLFQKGKFCKANTMRNALSMCCPASSYLSLSDHILSYQLMWDTHDLNTCARKLNFYARLPSKMNSWSSKTKLFCETSFKNEALSKIKLWSPKTKLLCAKYKTSVTWNLQPFHRFSVRDFKHRHHRSRNPCACHAKSIVSDPLQAHRACQRFCNPHELLRLPRILQQVEIPAPAARKAFISTSKNAPRPSVFNDFDFQIALELNFKKRSEPPSS